MRRLAGLVRLVHPFPSLLDGLVVAAVAAIAGNGIPSAAALGLSMSLLQGSIGALNDLVDAPVDAGRKLGKPIPAGLVTRRAALIVVGVAALSGIALAVAIAPVPVRLAMALLATVVLVIGATYDLRAKGTAWSWLPFALGIPLLPVYGWFGTTGSLPGWFGALVPMAVLAGSALAIANARADIERDREAGIGSVAVRLGLADAWTVHVVLWGLAAILAVGWLVASAVEAIWVAAVVVTMVPLAGAIILGRAGDPARRERAWQIEAVAVGLVAVVWLAAVDVSGGLM